MSKTYKPYVLTIKTIYGLSKELKLKDPYGKDYATILNHVLKLVGEKRDLYNYLEGSISSDRNRLEALEQLELILEKVL